MKKSEKLPHLVNLLLLLVLLISFNSCKKDIIPQPLNENLSILKRNEIIKSISFSEFKKKVDINRLGNLRSTFSQEVNQQQQIKLQSSNINQFILNADSVKLVSKGDTSSYVFSIKPNSPRAVYFQNLTVQVVKDSIKAFLTTYIPSKDWIIKWRQNPHLKWEGTTKFERVDLNKNDLSNIKSSDIKISSQNIKVNDVTVCHSYIITYEYPNPAYNPDAPRAAGVMSLEEIKYLTGSIDVTECETFSTGAGNGGGGSGGGGSGAGDGSGGGGYSGGGGTTSGGSSGGNTTPYPPDDFNPCDIDQTNNSNGGLQVLSGRTMCDATDPNNPVLSFQYRLDRVSGILGLSTAEQNTILQYPFILDELEESFRTYSINEEFLVATHVTLAAYETNSFSSDFATTNICQQLNIPFNPVLIGYFNAHVAILKHQGYSTFDAYWEASKEIVHLALDIGGLVPVIGEVCDLTSATLYLIEGDGMNAALSAGAAIPFAGWVSTGAKFAIKAVDAANSSKTTLKWIKLSSGAIEFVNRGQLRTVLKLAKGNLLQAHHLIPWELKTHAIVQQAAKWGFHMNEALNGIALAKSVHIENFAHPLYNNKVLAELQEISRLNPNITPQVAEQELIDLIGKIRTWITNHPGQALDNIVF